ncbi:Ig-like domain-containing protein [Myxococcota bacterium]|nr:Ig-like domain-containing protein [Myxococcota bacterium]
MNALLSHCAPHVLATASLSLSVVACLGSPGPSIEDRAPAIVAIEPAIDVGPESSVALIASEPLLLTVAEWPVAVVDALGNPVSASVALSGDGRAIVLSPAVAWPQGARLTVEIDDGFVDVEGRALAAPDVPWGFETRAPPPRPVEVSVRSPLPGRAAPVNLRWVTLLLEHADDRLPATVELVSGTSRVAVEVFGVEPGGLVQVRVPEHRGACEPLCPGARYHVEVDGVPASAAGLRGEVATATITDVVPPTVTSTRVEHRGDRVIVEVRASEPVRLRASVRSPFGEEVEVERSVLPLEEHLVEPEGLAADEDYVVVIEGEDLAGLPLPVVEVPVHTEPAISVEITEIVASPRHDWGDSVPVGAPFDARPGAGAVTTADEWIELVNVSTVPIDLSRAGLRVVALDGSPTETLIEGAPSLYFGDDGSRVRWWPGEALVVRLRGSLSERSFSLELLGGSRRLDAIVVGAVEGAVMRTGTPPDLEHESLARCADGRFRWCRPTPGDPRPSTDCVALPGDQPR